VRCCTASCLLELARRAEGNAQGSSWAGVPERIRISSTCLLRPFPSSIVSLARPPHPTIQRAGNACQCACWPRCPRATSSQLQSQALVRGSPPPAPFLPAAAPRDPCAASVCTRPMRAPLRAIGWLRGLCCEQARMQALVLTHAFHPAFPPSTLPIHTPPDQHPSCA